MSSTWINVYEYENGKECTTFESHDAAFSDVCADVIEDLFGEISTANYLYTLSTAPLKKVDWSEDAIEQYTAGKEWEEHCNPNPQLFNR